MSVFQILVLDSDPWTVKMMESLLQQRGHQVSVATTIEEAGRKLAISVPDLLIADAQLEPDGLDWLDRLRGSISGATLPVLLLADCAPPALRMDALRVPHSDFLDKPFRFDEFDLRVERLLPHVKPQAEPAPSRTHGLHGTIGDLSLASILLLIETEQKSGVLTVQRPGEVGRFFCAHGRLLSAERTVTGQRPERSLDAAFALLGWPDGDFEFVSSPPPPIDADDEGLCITQLVLLLAKRQDEQTRQQSIAV